MLKMLNPKLIIIRYRWLPGVSEQRRRQEKQGRGLEEPEEPEKQGPGLSPLATMARAEGQL